MNSSALLLVVVVVTIVAVGHSVWQYTHGCGEQWWGLTGRLGTQGE